MTVSSGFFVSVNADRAYGPDEFAQIFNGVIKDGVYQSVGDAFAVRENGGMNITVGTGRAWFNNTWTYNDAKLVLGVPIADAIYPRIDAVVLEVNKTNSVRANSIKIEKGVAGNNPSPPAVGLDSQVFKYHLAHIRVNPLVKSIGQADITQLVGRGQCPYVTAPLEVIDLNRFVMQWEGQWNSWFKGLNDTSASNFNDWMNEQKGAFEAWRSKLNTTLEGNIAQKLAAQIAELQLALGTMQDESVLQQTITDSDGDSILDSAGHPLNAKLIYTLK